MSENQEGQEPPQDIPSEPTVTYDVFEVYYKGNPDLDNAEYYQAFPSVNPGTIRSWKSKAKTKATAEPSSQQSTSTPPKEPLQVEKDFLETLKAIASPQAKGYAKIFEDKGDIKSAILVLQEDVKNQKPMPNMPGIPQPTGIPKVGLAKYMKYTPGIDKISWEIPMSELLDPEKNKKLGEYQ